MSQNEVQNPQVCVYCLHVHQQILHTKLNILVSSRNRYAFLYSTSWDLFNNIWHKIMMLLLITFSIRVIFLYAMKIEKKL